MRRLLPLALLVPVFGCAPASAPIASSGGALASTAEPPPAVEAAGSGYYVRLSRDDGLSVAGIDGAKPAVFQALLGAFEDVGLEIEAGDRVRGLVQSEQMVKSGEFAGERMSRLLHCGTSLTGDRANSWRIEFDVSAQVQSLTANRTQLTTRMRATATAMDGTSRNSIACTTRGMLEQMIVEATAVRLRSGRP